jgi:hypothetical protein
MATITGNGAIVRQAANVDVQNAPATVDLGNFASGEVRWVTIDNTTPFKNKGNVNQTLSVSNVTATGATVEDAQVFVGGQPKGTSADLTPSEVAVIKVQLTADTVTPYKPNEPQTVPVSLTFDYNWS